MVFILMICLLPAFAVALNQIINPESENITSGYVAFLTLMFNSLANTFIYIYRDEKFKTALYSLLHIRSCDPSSQ